MLKCHKTIFLSFVLLICIVLANPVKAIGTNTNIPNTDTSNSNYVSSSNVSQSVRYIKLRVLLGDTYRETFSDYSTRSQRCVALLDIPFIATWNIGFTESFTNVNPLPIDYCTLSNSVLCSDSICGSNCNNYIDNIVHHKNIVKNSAAVEYYIPITGYDIMLTLISSEVCGIWNNQHTDDKIIFGVAPICSDYAMVNILTYFPENVHIRIMQHEISHLFGCNDGYCTLNEPCIMNGGYDYEDLDATNIWCTACSQMFNPNAQ